ncbi:fimbria/pilus periplasmic chaperone [Roseibacterium beibuensis]|uniref:fimbria/pilus periplasmic chaperone n=1 Tax=[Roseibacterium] beibuensis TaxID=1193142 RepID=UPI00217E0519|nr:fimbria/pilus periplasmic chaperone [Roseibacterium beibuensis]MCS6622538.1 fimbria/pilus periplasmic chaperone [Roseibacterium beibuensis]
MSILKRIGAVLAALAITILPAASTAMSVQPVVIDMTTSGRGMSATMTVENSFTTPLPVELTVQELSFDENGVTPTGVDPGDLLIFPPQAIIEPGRTQSFRVQWVGDPEIARSKHYYITVAQLPVELPEGQSGIQILYNFQTVVSVAAPGGRAELSVVSVEPVEQDGKAVVSLLVKNEGNNYDYVSRQRLALEMRNPGGEKIFERTLTGAEIQQIAGFGLIGPETQRRLVIPIELPQADGVLTAELTRDQDR